MVLRCYQIFNILFAWQEKGDPVIACQVNNDKNFAFLEFRSTEEATKVSSLNNELTFFADE